MSLARTLTLNFQGKLKNLLYLRQKWSIATEWKANISIEIQASNVTNDVNLWIFKVRYRICSISAKSGPIATEWKTNILIELQASNVTNGFDLDHDFNLCILEV